MADVSASGYLLPLITARIEGEDRVERHGGQRKAAGLEPLEPALPTDFVKKDCQVGVQLGGAVG